MPKCCRCPTTDATQSLNYFHSSVANERLKSLMTQIMSLSEQSPVLMIFEDAHWIDPTSLEALGRGIDRIKSYGVLLIITHRPEFEPPWIGRPYVTALTLNRLGEREIAAMIDGVSGNKPLPESIRRTSSSVPMAFLYLSRK